MSTLLMVLVLAHGVHFPARRPPHETVRPIATTITCTAGQGPIRCIVRFT